MFIIIRALCLIALLVVTVFFASTLYPWAVAIVAFIYWRRRFGL